MGNFKSELKGLNRFQPIPRDLIQDCGLSAQARFIYSYMAAKPEGWEFWQDVMAREVKMGVDTLRKYLHELRDAGWLEIGKQGNSSGRFGATQYILRALPYGKISDTEKFRHGKIPTRKNSAYINNTDSSKDIDTSKKTKKADAPLPLPFSSDRFREAWETLLETWKEGLPASEWKKKTPNALRLTLKRLGKYDEAFAIELIEKTTEHCWRGVIFPDTDAKYQEWKSARQLAEDNRQPRTTPPQGKPKQIDPNNQVDAFYREKNKNEEEERAKLVAELKAKYGVKDDNTYDKAGG